MPSPRRLLSVMGVDAKAEDVTGASTDRVVIGGGQAGLSVVPCLVVLDNEFRGRSGKSIPADAGNNTGPRQHPFRSEALGYFAMLAFLCAYLLSVVDAGPLIQTTLNLAGALVGAIYLRKKDAIPSVISNLAWAAITVGGLVLGS